MHPQHQPRPQPHRHRAARPAKRVHKPLFILGVPVVVIAAIAVGTDDDTGAGSTGEREPRARPTTVPEYKVIREGHPYRPVRATSELVTPPDVRHRRHRVSHLGRRTSC